MDAKILKKLKSYKWERWLERPFGAFILSFFKEGASRKWMKKLGVNAEYQASIFQDGVWYRSDKVTSVFEKELTKYLKSGGSIFNISKSCENFWKMQKKQTAKITKYPEQETIEKLKEFYKIFTQIVTYIWLAHGLEDVYQGKLNEEIPKYIKEDVDNYILKMIFPEKKNMHAYLERALLRSGDFNKIKDKFGWIKVRDGFSDGFSIKELKSLRKKLLKSKLQKLPKLKIPKPLQKLAREFQELVYFRTLRGDVLFDLFFRMRPVLKEVARKYGLSFKDLRDYSIHDLIAGRPKRYPSKVTAVFYRGDMAFFNRPFLKEERIESKEIKGQIAFLGKVRGPVKIVKFVSELNKVRDGDILVTQMTFPSFIPAMRRAKAFITDEGGITCHAAIIAREMKKPCIIGTKIATRVLRDGDLIEVDAERGIVKKL
jgi:phosphohistidine swiveling domain-containing protein